MAVWSHSVSHGTDALKRRASPAHAHSRAPPSTALCVQITSNILIDSNLYAGRFVAGWCFLVEKLKR